MSTSGGVVTIGEWLPDLPAMDNPGTLVAKNCLPQLKSYRSLNSLGSFTNALASACVGAFWLQGSDNTIYNFCGDVANLYRLDGNITWTNVNGGSAPYAAQDWNFTKFGDRVLAVNILDPMQKYEVGTDSAFADQPGSPPQAAQIATVRDFVVVGDLDAFGPNVVQWSGFNNSEIWGVNRRAQADRQEIPGRGGRVQKIVPGEYGVIVQEHSITRMDYIGPAPIFQFDEVERGRGTPSPNSVVWVGNLVFYYGWDGFYLFNGQQSEPISANRVAKWFIDNTDVEALADIRGVVDRQNRLVLWAAKSSNALAYNDLVIIFNWTANRWSYAEVDTEVLAEYIVGGFDLDSLDTPLSGGIDTDSIPVDSDRFRGGALSLQAFDSSHKSAKFDSTPLVAQLDTTEMSAPDNSRMYTNSVRPIVEGTPGTSTTVSIGSRNQANENVVFTSARALNSIGEANIRLNSRYQRYRLNIAGGFEHATGVKVQSKSGGRR